MIYLSIIIPAYNEEKRIGASLKKIIDFLKMKKYDSEIIVVNDGSTDGTISSISELIEKEAMIKIVSNPQNRGKGYSVKKGVEMAEGEFILFSDADLSTPIEEVEKLLAEITVNNFDIAIGSRALKDSQVIIHQPFYREYMGKIFNKIARLFTFSKIYDSQCGFKLFKKDIAKRIFKNLTIERFAFDAEIIFLAQKYGYKIKETPVRWYNSPHTRVNILRDSVNMLFDIVKIWLNDIRGIYR